MIENWGIGTARSLLEVYAPDHVNEFWTTRTLRNVTRLPVRTLPEVFWIMFSGHEMFEILATMAKIAAGEIPDGWERAK